MIEYTINQFNKYWRKCSNTFVRHRVWQRSSIKSKCNEVTDDQVSHIVDLDVKVWIMIFFLFFSSLIYDQQIFFYLIEYYHIRIFAARASSRERNMSSSFITWLFYLYRRIRRKKKKKRKQTKQSIFEYWFAFCLSREKEREKLVNDYDFLDKARGKN